jgi:hypothetical protein
MKKTQAVAKVEESTDLNTTPREILLKLNHNRDGNIPRVLIICKDISNLKQAQRKRFLAGRTPIEALLDYLKSRPDYWFSTTYL